jgi:hypothetical protein
MICWIVIFTGLNNAISIFYDFNAGFRILSYQMINFSISSVWQVTVELQKLVKAIGS